MCPGRQILGWAANLTKKRKKIAKSAPKNKSFVVYAISFNFTLFKGAKFGPFTLVTPLSMLLWYGHKYQASEQTGIRHTAMK